MHTAAQPNVLYINCDDLGYGDLGCYGSTVNQTPTIDKLAEEGVRFTSFYAASSVCTPSRAALMTGCYAQRVEMPAVIFPAAKTGLNKNEYTLGKLFKDQGYATMIIGKWHCGDNAETLPCHFGFDDYYGIPYSNDMGRQKGANEHMPPLPLMHGHSIIEEQPDQCGITERYTERAVEFIRRNASQPFFLYMAHMHVHLPLYEQERFLRESKNGDYGACVASLDFSLAAILHELKRLNIYHNTIIIFTSDNGSRAADGASNAPLRGCKFTAFEGGFRVPFIAHWKGHFKEHALVDQMASNIDMLPTFAALLQSPLSSNKIDGVNILPNLFGENIPIRDEFAYYCKYSLAAIRKGKYKLHVGRIYDADTFDKPELYDLSVDVAEQNNLYESEGAIANELNTLCDPYRWQFGDDLLGMKGHEIRPCTKIENPAPLTEYDENHPYIVAMYDKEDRG